MMMKLTPNLEETTLFFLRMNFIETKNSAKKTTKQYKLTKNKHNENINFFKKTTPK